jgi:hypothetical protein
MEIKFHGGECCGVKHISGFFSCPDQTAREKDESARRNHDKMGDTVRSDWNFCWESLPTQTYKERLVAYIDFLKRVRPSGAVELTLTDYQLGMYGWKPVLEELGFKQVVSFWNSNSGNNVFVYYLVYGGKKCAIEAYNSPDDEEDD